jgi:hypothetical protein
MVDMEVFVCDTAGLYQLSTCIRNFYIKRNFVKIEIGVETDVVLKQVFQKPQSCVHRFWITQGVGWTRMIHLTEL